MKKKILFVIPTLKSGGAEKSLVTVLQLFDYDKYDVTLFLFRKEGLFLEQIPDCVKIIDAGESFRLFDGDAKIAISHFLKKGKFDLVIKRVIYGLSLNETNLYQKEVKIWNWLKSSVEYPEGHFDCAIGYLEGPSDWMALETDASKKIGYMHSYLDKSGFDKKHFNETVSSFDEFVTVSESCAENLKNMKPAVGSVSVIHNIISPKVIKNLSDEPIQNLDGEVALLTIGRLSREKGFDMAIEAAKLLKNKGYDFCWYHIGSGPLKQELEKAVCDSELQKNVIFLGEKANPYPYLKKCDIYVQPSRYEGKSIAVDEAKALCKPIAVTNFPSVYDQIQHGVNGIICEMNAESVADGIEKLISDPDLCKKLSEKLSTEEIGNEQEINKLYELIER